MSSHNETNNAKFITWEDFTRYSIPYDIILSTEWTATITSGLPTFLTFLDSDNITKGMVTFPNANAYFTYSPAGERTITNPDDIRRGAFGGIKLKFTVLPSPTQEMFFDFGDGHRFKVDSSGTLWRNTRYLGWVSEVPNLFADLSEHEIVVVKRRWDMFAGLFPTTEGNFDLVLVDNSIWLSRQEIPFGTQGGFNIFRVGSFTTTAIFTCSISIIYIKTNSNGLQVFNWKDQGLIYRAPTTNQLQYFDRRIPPCHDNYGGIWAVDRNNNRIFVCNEIAVGINPDWRNWTWFLALSIIELKHYIFALTRFNDTLSQIYVEMYFGYDGTRSVIFSNRGGSYFYITGERTIDLFCPDGLNDSYVLTAPASGTVNNLYLRKRTGAGGSYTLVNTYPVSPSFIWTTANPFPIWGFYNKLDGYYYFVANNLAGNNYATWYRISLTPGSTTINALYNFPTGYKLPTDNNYPILCDNVFGEGVFVTLYNAAGPDYKTYYSTLFNTASFSVFSNYAFKFPQPRDYPFYRSDTYWRNGTRYGACHRRMAVEMQTPISPHYWAEYINHLLKIRSPDPSISSIYWVSAFGVMLQDSSENWIQYYLEPDTQFQGVDIEKSITQTPTLAKVKLNPSDTTIVADGNFFEMYDGFDNLLFIGKNINPLLIGNKNIVEMDLVGLDYDLYRKINYDAKTKTTAEILKYLVEGCDFIYHDASIDPNGDFTLTYDRKVAVSLDKVIPFFRNLERGLFYSEPDGKIYFRKYTRTISTNLHWSHRNPNIKLVNVSDIDLQATRVEVSGGHNTAGQVRRIYIGDATLETKFGIYAIQKNDPAIMNDTECLQTAENTYKLLANDIGGGRRSTKFLRLIVANQGNIQVGKTISFKWEDGIFSVPLGDYYIVEWRPYRAADDICEVWLANNIVLLKEYQEATRSIKRDDELTGTYYDSDKTSTINGTPVTQNSVSRLRAGTYIWRTPEPLAFDFTKTALPVGAGAWATLNLAAILPDGVRSVHIRTQYRSSSSAAYFLYRKFGNTGNIQGVGDSVDNTGKDHEGFSVVGVSEDKKIDVYSSITQANWTTWNMVIVGWDV